MSFFSWFAKKNAAGPVAAAESSGLGHVDATVPFDPAAKGMARAQPQADFAANRKGERLERRELLYTVVRESLTAAGILSASYKFKVLSLDSRGRQYLIMMDIDRRYASDHGRFAGGKRARGGSDSHRNRGRRRAARRRRLRARRAARSA